ncbi:MAG: LysM peptidoglycan-binding domain-containing protein [Verrucomicrobiota bacterium]|nr:LysM peptidoglycan-binding domain-containing protein [Verrucomicrobiota bacterium]
MKLPKFPQLKRPKKRLRATAVRRSAMPQPEYDDMAEPNMKLSRALLIVLLLHVVAVAGIIAFNAIKSRQENSAPQIVSANDGPGASPAAMQKEPEKIAATKSERESKGSAAHSDFSKTYVVAKGDNPVKIAKKFKVPYDDLLAANHIDDPRKLKIGQKLIIPMKKTKRN